VSIKDVAALAGVSITTVSHALNGKGRLPPETRARVRAVARTLGYRPNRHARSLAGGHAGLLALTISRSPGVWFPLGDLDYFSELISAATTTAIEHGYPLVTVPAASSSLGLLDFDTDGAVVIDPIVDDPTLAELRARGIPFVTTGRDPAHGDEDCWVDNDQVAGLRAILDHLAAAGAGRIAMIIPPAQQSYTLDSERAYHAWCAETRQEPIVAQPAEDLTERGGYAAALELLRRPDPPDAIYAALDRLALGVFLAASAEGISIPGELLVAGCTDSEAAKSAQPRLTTLSLHPGDIGRAAVSKLIDLVEDGELEDRHTLIEATVIPRESTARAGAQSIRS